MSRAGTKRKLIIPSLQANPTRKGPRTHLRDVVDTVENLDIRQLIVPIRKVTKIRAQKETLSTKRNSVLKETIFQKLNVLIVVNKDSMQVAV